MIVMPNTQRVQIPHCEGIRASRPQLLWFWGADSLITRCLDPLGQLARLILAGCGNSAAAYEDRCFHKGTALAALSSTQRVQEPGPTGYVDPQVMRTLGAPGRVDGSNRFLFVCGDF